MKPDTAKNVEDYLAQIPTEAARQALATLRRIILEDVPEAEEKISYGIPTYCFSGHIASIAAFKNHCSFFPGHTVRDFTMELDGFKTAKGTVQFKPEKPIPELLVREMVRARLSENKLGSKK